MPALQLFLRPEQTLLRLLSIEPMRQAILLTCGLTQAGFHRFTQTLLQAEQGSLLTGQTQLWMLLLQAMLKTRVKPLLARQVVIHRHLQPLLLRLQLAQQFQLVPADDFCGC